MSVKFPRCVLIQSNGVECVHLHGLYVILSKCFSKFYACSQYTTVRQWQPVVQMVLFWGDRGLEAVRNFERVERNGLAVHTFRKLAQVQDPAFLEGVLSVMRASKPTIGQFANAVVKASRLQWYTWQVMHPDNSVHPDRSVCC